MPKIRIGISSCLLGEPVRYDGGHKRDQYIIDELGRYFELTGVCPEREAGMPVPRDAMRLAGDAEAPRLVVICSNQDLTGQMQTFCDVRVAELAQLELCGFVFKGNSPSCGLSQVPVYPLSGDEPLAEGRGLFAAALAARLPEMPMVEDGFLHEPAHCRAFVARVLQYARHLQED